MRSTTRIAATLLLTAGLWLALVAAMPPLAEADRAAIAGLSAQVAACSGVPQEPGCWFFGR
jgi:hypothetical protein